VDEKYTKHTTAAVQRYLNELAGVRGDSPAEPWSDLANMPVAGRESPQ
jgi:hypothetical protein